MNGIDAGVFSPNTNLTRAMLVTILWRFEGEPAVNGKTAADNGQFSDVADGSWYSDAVMWAAGKGIIEGYGDGRFGPNDEITREQLVTILFRYMGEPGDSSTLPALNSQFTDAGEVSDWAEDAIKWAVAGGLIIGRDEGILAPKGTATRAEAATILMRLIEKGA